MALREDLLKPISESRPSGENIRNDPSYDKAKDLRKTKEDPFTGTIPPDWKAFVKVAEDVLAKKSKDLQLAVWLTEAYTVLKGLTGLRDGLTLVKDYIENYWETLWPELEDGTDAGLRLAPLDQLGGGFLDVAIKQSPITKGGHHYLDYHQSQIVGFLPAEDDYSDAAAQQKTRHEEAAKEGKLTGEVFMVGFEKTPKQYFVDLGADLEAMLNLIQELNASCEQKFSDEPPSFQKLSQSISQVQISVEALLDKKREKEPDDDGGGGTGDEPGGEEDSGGVSESHDSSSDSSGPAKPVRKKKKLAGGVEPADMDEIGDRLCAIADFMRAQDVGNPGSYLMLRGYRWGEIRANGGTAPDQTLLEAPATEVRTNLKKNLIEGYYAEVLRDAEQAMSTPAGRGWLDLQRYAVTALDNLGYSTPANAIKSELKALLLDMPDMLNMTLMDDTPVANSETQQWIKDNVLPPPPPAPESQPEPGPGPVVDYSSYYRPEPSEQTQSSESGEPLPPDAFQLAQEAAQSGNHEQAIEILVREMSQERCGRSRFNRKLQLAQICLSIGQSGIARPILEELTGEIEKRKLDEWETGDTCAHALSLLYKCMDGEGDQARKQELYRWICRLDPVQALSCRK